MGSFSCGIYSFTGASIPAGTETFQVNFFKIKQETALDLPLNRDWIRSLPLHFKDRILNLTNLSLTNSNGDLVYEGEIVEFSITPMSATAEIKAAQNRLTMGVNLRYFNTKNEEDDFEKKYSFFYDFPANKQFYDVQNNALDEIFERITQDIFNETLAKW